MPIEFPPKDGVRFIKNVMVPTSDGVHLAMDMHVPDAEDWWNTPCPLILEYIPYRKDDSAPYSGYHNTFAQHGFIGARMDCRGTGSSGGVNTDEYTSLEQQDCVEAIEWIAQQPWSTGKTAMFGASYGGFTAVQIAAHHPPTSPPSSLCTSPTTATPTTVTTGAAAGAATTTSAPMALP
jgi:hypothetical protein